LVVPDMANLSEWASQNGVDLGDVGTNEKVRQLLKGEIDKFSALPICWAWPRSPA
jgi:hypothetical protein